MISIAICEDESYFLDNISKLLFNYLKVKNIEASVTKFISGEEFLISGQDADIILMDIQLPGVDGMTTMERLRTNGKSGQVRIFLIHILLLFLFAVFLLKIKWTAVIAPLVIVLTLYTFVEGYSAICMYWTSVSVTSITQGRIIQFLISLVLDFLFWGVLKLIHMKYFYAMQQSVSSYLYILLLPCGLIVLFVRIGLKPDSHALEKYFSAIGLSASFTAFLVMCAAAMIFLLMIKITSKIVYLSEKETDTAILKAQLNGQKIYVEEAQKRNKEYSHFQHDIDNHLLVLSGLIHDGKYLKAEQYINQLHIRCELLLFPVSTGNAVLDVLLKEKLSYAASNGVEINCNVKIPNDFHFDDMDLCIIFANILDNAICACINNSHEKDIISIGTKAHARFLVIEEINTTSMHQPVIEGTGITNIKNVAQKYHGTVEVSDNHDKFRISVLLCSPEF